MDCGQSPQSTDINKQYYMTKKLQQKIGDSVAARWTVLIAVSLTMMCGYFMCDVMAPLKSLLEEIMHWSSIEYGIFSSGYGWLNVTLLMLIVGGIILDRKGPRFTGVFATGVMLVGAVMKYYAIEFIDPLRMVELPLVGQMRYQLLIATLGYAIFAFGYETMGITATKIVVRWFKGKELALALGMNVAFARLGTMLALAAPLPIAKYFNSISMPILFCTVLLMFGFVAFMIFMSLDKKLDKERESEKLGDDEKFKLEDIKLILRNRGFWYISLLCLLFYAAVFPFLKFATEYITIEYNVDPEFAGLVPALLPLGTLFLTPLFGGIYDRKGRGATIMIIGSLMLVFVYAVFILDGIDHWITSVAMMIVLGVAFSLVPSAMWPSVAKIIPEKRLGTAYALIFWVQNIGLAGVPLLIGWVLDRFGQVKAEGQADTYDYTYPIFIFFIFCLCAVIFALLLKREDKIKGYGLEKANISKEDSTK